MQHRCDYIIRIGIASLMLVPAFSLACTCKAWGEISEDKVIDAMCAVDVVFVGKATDLVSTINQERDKYELLDKIVTTLKSLQLKIFAI